MKKVIALLLTLVMFIGICSVGFVSADAATNKVITLRLHDKNAYVNGKKVTIDSEGTFPFVLNGSTMVPIRFISEKMGATVTYKDATKPITVKFGTTTLSFMLDSKKITKTENGKTSTVQMVVAATIINGKTFIPLRAVSENIGWAVEYIAADHTIIISTAALNAADLKTQTALGQKLTFNNVKMTSLKINPNKAQTIDIGSKVTVAGVPTPANATLGKVLIYTSSKPSVATVSSTGVVKGVSAGKTTISVKNNDGKLKASITVTVVDSEKLLINAMDAYHAVLLKIEPALEAFRQSGTNANNVDFSHFRTTSFKNNLADLNKKLTAVNSVANAYPRAKALYKNTVGAMNDIVSDLNDIKSIAANTSLTQTQRNEIVTKYNHLANVLYNQYGND